MTPFQPRILWQPDITRLSRRIGLRTIGSIGGVVVIPIPSTLGDATNAIATEAPFQRKSFFANGRFWVFYTNNSNLVYRTSQDNKTWTDETVVATIGLDYGQHFAIYFDGQYVHYAYTNTGVAEPIFYRRGEPESDGTITWSATEQEATPRDGGISLWNPSISVDSDGYVWIGYQRSGFGISRPYITKSGNNDGTWGTTPAGFPYRLSTTSADWAVMPVSLTSEKMLIIYAPTGGTVKAQAWDGLSWGTEIDTTSAIEHCWYCSAVGEGDDVHLVFLVATTYDIVHVTYDYASNSWGAETTIQASVASTTGPVLSINQATGRLYCFWSGSPTPHHLYYKKRVGTTWDSNPTDWIDESLRGLTYDYVLTSFSRAYNRKIGLAYTRNTTAFQVRFNYLIM